MGTWGNKPTENGAASDWLESLISNGIETKVREQLHADIHEEPEQIRAAAHLVRVLVSADIWPSELRKEFASLARDHVEQMLSTKLYANFVAIAEIRQESATCPQSDLAELSGSFRI